MIFSKRSKIVVDAFTANPMAHDYAPIDYAAKFLPKWWRDLPTTAPMLTPSGLLVEQSTMKHCKGMTDLYQNSLMIPLWSDLAITTVADGRWGTQWSDTSQFSSNILQHPPVQFGEMSPNDIHIKIVSPWIMSEKTGVNFLFTAPTWNNPNPFLRALPGVMNYKYQHSTNINLLAVKADASTILKHGEPLIHLIPMCDDRITVKTHLIDQREFERLSVRTAGTFTFKNLYQSRKKINDSEGKKCPFHNLTSSESIWKKFKSTSSSGAK